MVGRNGCRPRVGDDADEGGRETMLTRTRWWAGKDVDEGGKQHRRGQDGGWETMLTTVENNANMVGNNADKGGRQQRGRGCGGIDDPRHIV